MKTRVESLGISASIKKNFADHDILTVRGVVQQTDDQIQNIAGSFEGSVGVIDSLDRLALEIQLLPPTDAVVKTSSPENIPANLIADDDIIDTFAKVFKLDKETIESSSRKQEVVKVRDLIAYVLREYADMSFPSIGRLLGGRDHTTIIHSYKKIKVKLQNKPVARAELNELISKAEAIKERKIHIEERLIPDLIASIKDKQLKSSIRSQPIEIPDRNLKILDLYRQGLTLRNIGVLFKVTHERVRQIVEKTIRQTAFNESLSKGIDLDVEVLLEEERKMRGSIRNKGRQKEKPVREKRWSRYYMTCKSCGSTSLPHVKHGLCEKCVGHYRSGRREEIIARHENKCNRCGKSREDSMREYGRDFYITKDQSVYCKKCFLSEGGKMLGASSRRGKNVVV